MLDRLQSSPFDLAGVVAFGMKAIAWLFSAISTAGFLYTFGGPLFAFLLPSPLAELLAAAVGVLFVEVPALTWPHVRLNKAGNENQRKIAELMTWASVAAALALTTAFFVLTFGAVEISAAVAGWAGLLGSSAVVLAFVLNFAAWALFNRLDNRYTLLAELRDMGASIERQAYGEIMLRTAQNVDGLIADAVAEQTDAARNSILYAIGGPSAVARRQRLQPPRRQPEATESAVEAPVPAGMAGEGEQAARVPFHVNGSAS